MTVFGVTGRLDNKKAIKIKKKKIKLKLTNLKFSTKSFKLPTYYTRPAIVLHTDENRMKRFIQKKIRQK